MGLFKFSDKVRKTEELGEVRVSQHTCVAPVPSDKNVFIKTCLDIGEGPPPSKGRYRTFYNMYWVNRQWYLTGMNKELLANVLPSFVVVEHPDLKEVFMDRDYSPEFMEWIWTSSAQYYQVLPITTLSGGRFKFAGVNIPDRASTVPGKFSLVSDALTVKDTCIFGQWLHGDITHCATMPARRQYETVSEKMTSWLVSEIEALGHLCYN